MRYEDALSHSTYSPHEMIFKRHLVLRSRILFVRRHEDARDQQGRIFEDTGGKRLVGACRRSELCIGVWESDFRSPLSRGAFVTARGSGTIR